MFPATLTICCTLALIPGLCAQSSRAPAAAAEIPLPEHPRPDFERAQWINLNGVWDFDFDDEDAGLAGRWYEAHTWSRAIVVPYVHQARRSGIADERHHGVIWYHRRIVVPPSWRARRTLLHIGAADFRTRVWVNGREAGRHEGGYTPIDLDISEHLLPAGSGTDEVTIRVFDDARDPAQPRGKQHPSGGRNRWHYTHLSGIWQTVWLEAVERWRISGFRAVTRIGPPRARFEVRTVNAPDGAEVAVELIARGGGAIVGRGAARVRAGVAALEIACPAARPWSPEHPELVDLRLELRIAGRTADRVRSYLGFREVAARDGAFWLNGSRVWLNGALDQGYFPGGLYTPPSDRARIEDVQAARRLGLNMIRKHQMVADPRFLYHCDRLGLMVWGEMANAGEGHFSERAAALCLREWERVIRRDANHPCIVTWVYSNEGWMHGDNGPAVIAHYRQAYARLKGWDPTRPVIDTSGYYHVRTDILDVHRHGNRLADACAWARGELAHPARSALFLVDDFPYEGQPIIASEWTPGDFSARDSARWLHEYLVILGELAANPLCAGHCYVQLYDIENERNGYLTYDRRPKIDAETIRLAHELARRRTPGLFGKVLGEHPSSAPQVLVATSERAPQRWKYTLEQPPADWTGIAFDDSSWRAGAGPFGSAGTPGIAPRTSWNAAQIWMRREFELRAEPPPAAWLRLYHDEDVEVFVNGVVAARAAGWSTSYEKVALAPAARAALRVGRNVLALRCRQSSGGQGVDAGIAAGELPVLELSAPHGRLRAIPGAEGYRIEVLRGAKVLLSSPPEGLWSIASDWREEWPAGWKHARPQEVEREGPWLIASGKLAFPGGEWLVRDAYRAEENTFCCVRRFTWRGAAPARHCTLSVRWRAGPAGGRLFLPGICLYGNPSGVRTAAGAVIGYAGRPGEEAICEEHRFAIPFASLEWSAGSRVWGAALHSLPSRAPWGVRRDLWWSLGAAAHSSASELLLLSGPCAANGQRSVVKAQQGTLMKYPDTYLDVPSGAVIEKTFFLEAYPAECRGAGFRRPLRSALARLHTGDLESFPSFGRILRAKVRFARSRWHEGPRSAGFRMYPGRNTYVMGWAGQCEAPGYALLVLAEHLGGAQAIDMAQRSLDFLAGAPFNDKGFLLAYDPDSDRWSRQDFVSQGQAMDSFARAIRVGRRMPEVRTERWEVFLRRAADLHAARLLDPHWRPRSSAEGFLVAPLAKAYELFGAERYRRAAIRAAEHYAKRHLDMSEPCWGGTLDARCEDKEGAWAVFQAFLAVWEMSGERRYLSWAEHALDVLLSYTVVWNVDMPPGRLRDHAFRSRGWTVVSAQNQHLDVYGVVTTPQIYRMGEILGREDLKRLALLMYRSCGQLIDPYGSQGEQIQQTNFAQQGDLSDLRRLRGGYSEGWTVFWITAHFLNAAAQLEEMGVDLGW